MKKFKASQQISYILKVVQHEIRKRMDDELKKVGLTTPQYAIISELDEYPKISNAQLARACFVTPQTMNLIVKNLEKRELIVRSSDKNHGRIQNIELTKTGEKLLQKAHRLVADIQKDLFSAFSEDETGILKQLLLKINVGTFVNFPFEM